VSSLPTPALGAAPEIAPYWDAADKGALVVPRCRKCGRGFWYPRPFCPSCSSTQLAWEPVNSGIVYTFTVIHRSQGAWERVAPYSVAYVELEDGVRILTNIVNCDPSTIAIGQLVQPVFDGEQGQRILRFEPIP
jgi:uncharacterized protein